MVLVCGAGCEPPTESIIFAVGDAGSLTRSNVSDQSIARVDAASPNLAGYIRYSGAYVAEEAMARSAQKGMWAGAFIAPWDWRTRTASTAILGSYKPTEEQERLLLLPSTPQLQPKLPLSPRPQSQEQNAECLIKGNINPKGPGQRYYDKATINLSLLARRGLPIR
jgi:hypothetical protein